MVLKRNVVDHWLREAKRAGFVSRASFKLLEIQDRFKVIRPGNTILDLGCHPGSWLQVACKSLGPQSGVRGGSVIGLDLTPTPLPPKHVDGRVIPITGDLRDLSRPTPPAWFIEAARMLPPPAAASLRASLLRGFDVVLSDACHSTGGHADGQLSSDLARSVVDVSIGLGPVLGRVAAEAAEAAALELSTSGASPIPTLRRIQQLAPVQLVGQDRQATTPTTIVVAGGVSDTGLGRGARGAEPDRWSAGPGPGPALDAATPAPAPWVRTPALLPGGSLVVKVLMGQGFEELCAEVRPRFRRFQCFRPRATRAESKETYLVGLGLKESR